MRLSRQSSTLSSAFQLTLLIFAIITFMYFTGEVLKPLALSVLLSFALSPAVRFLERRRIPRPAAVAITGLLTMALLAGVGYVVVEQLSSLANRLPDYQGNIEAKLSKIIKPDQESAATRLQVLADEVTAKITKKPQLDDEEIPIQKVEVVDQPSFQERLRSSTGPYLEFLGVGSFVIVLVFFMLLGRDDIHARIIQLFGHHQVSLTTRTTDEIALRITRYLATFALVNSGFGLVIGLGLWVIGVPYAVLWGCLAAMLRFIPYVGPAVAFVLPLVFSFAHFPGWMQPIEVVGLFAVVEIALNSFLEPVIYAKTTGISALALLVAAMFWTWLWGTLGLLLSTPLTVCLAVLGKYVPALDFFATLLGEEAELEPDVRFYQRALALDRDRAFAMIEELFKQKPRVEVFDQVIVPALMRAERDAAVDQLGDREQALVWEIVGEVLEFVEGLTDSPPATGEPELDGDPPREATPAPFSPPVPILGIAVQDTSDALVLTMLSQILEPLGCTIEIINAEFTPLELAARIEEHNPRLVILSHLPPAGLTQARFLVRRLRAQFPDLPLLVGRWRESGGAAAAAERLVHVGATSVAFSLENARDRVLALIEPKAEPSARALLTPTKPARREATKVGS